MEKKKKNKYIGRMFTNKRNKRVFIFLIFLVLLYIVYNLIVKKKNITFDGDPKKFKFSDMALGTYFWFLFKILLVFIFITIIIPTIIFLSHCKGKKNLKDNRISADQQNPNNEKEDEDEDEDKTIGRIPEFVFETSKERSKCPVESFTSTKGAGVRVDPNTGETTKTRSLKGGTKKVKIPDYPNVNSDEWVHISKIPDMKNYVHKKDLPCMSNYVHKKEIPNMTEYVHKTKIPPVKVLKKTIDQPKDIDIDKINEVKKIYGIDLDDYILKSAIPSCLKCPDMNNYILKSSIPPF